MDQVRVSLGEAVSLDVLRIAPSQFCCQKDYLEARALAVCPCPPFEEKQTQKNLSSLWFNTRDTS